MLTTQLGYGGAETSFIRLANALAETMDVTVAVFTPTYGGSDYAAGHAPLQVPLRVLDAAQRSGFSHRWGGRLRQLRALKQQHDVTISFLSGPNMLNIAAGYPARTMVSLRGSRRYDPVAPRWQRWLFQWIIDPVVFRVAARIVPISPGLAEEIRSVAGAGALRKTVVIPPFIDEEAMRAKAAQPLPEPYAMLRGQKLVVAVGRLSVEKGFQHLIRVFATLTRQHPDAKLLLVGDGPMQAALRAICRAHGLAMDDLQPGVASVIFTRYQENVLPFMALARVYAMSSATEGFGNVVLEAMVAGVPVVAADTPWGARAILREDGQDSAEAYPTQEATAVAYGTLMPRIDRPEYHDIWVRTLSAHLDRPPASNPAIAGCLQRYAKDHVVEQWRQLLAGIARSHDV